VCVDDKADQHVSSPEAKNVVFHYPKC
jgi:hypothetical protein